GSCRMRRGTVKGKPEHDDEQHGDLGKGDERHYQKRAALLARYNPLDPFVRHRVPQVALGDPGHQFVVRIRRRKRLLGGGHGSRRSQRGGSIERVNSASDGSDGSPGPATPSVVTVT